MGANAASGRCHPSRRQDERGAARDHYTPTIEAIGDALLLSAALGIELAFQATAANAAKPARVLAGCPAKSPSP